MGDEAGNTPAIETMQLEERRYPPLAGFAAHANAQPDIYERDFEEFWETEARERVSGLNDKVEDLERAARRAKGDAEEWEQKAQKLQARVPGARQD